MAVGFIELLFTFSFLLVPFGFMLWALVDLLNQPAGAWKAAGQERLVWAIVVVFVGVIGPILYLAIARPKLAAVDPFRPLVS